ncbi:MAG: BON domain-containing protein [Pirellulaceae bacterium]|nr:BON domain-containing protein [Pirellulaceae bacterium]
MVASCDTDRVLQNRIATQLADTNRPSLKRLAVNVAGGSVTLRGSVSSFYEKQLAIQVCRVLLGVGRMIDAGEVAVAS